MYRNDFLFSSHLNYQINAAKPAEDGSNVAGKDITGINLRKCTFEDFSNALLYERG
ncbi:MAG: hypothetical protein IJJ59_08820 [Pseudobutyrivibrio sp.]|uniref:hypothetical protein n=1 Tax=Pseudobutyrivibrio sp. TaxID=2014367 RepID=UPI0025DE6DBE|nr:hypothetical protein [Pseudobutyrivibrio sp.]MBQ6463411.1 hypothetical protein [Pseudobutyrivibrio sp.]